jgi:hypothetical protein
MALNDEICLYSNSHFSFSARKAPQRVPGGDEGVDPGSCGHLEQEQEDLLFQKIRRQASRKFLIWLQVTL